MFGGSRRHRQANQPLTAATANPNAATAAASAFARRSSTSSLSSAAAAAALRSRPTTPINVAEVQTKRTQKRSASVSSHGSQDMRRGVQRSPSQSSMTERTFRSPSPHRTPMTPIDAPPVPAIPDDMRSVTSQSSSHKRATSLQMQPFRVASQKNKEGAGSWFGAAVEGNLANVRRSDNPTRVASPESRPGARLVSPRPTESMMSRTTTSEQSLIYDPNSRRMVPKVDALPREQVVRDTPEKPVKKKKKKQQQQGLARSGSHLAKGTVGRVQGSAVASMEATPIPTQREQPQVHVLTDTREQVTMKNQPQIKETAQPTPAQSQTPEPAPAVAPEPAFAPSATSRTHTTESAEPTDQQPAGGPEAEQQVVRDVRKSDGASALLPLESLQGAPVLGRKPSTVQEESEDELASSNDEAEPSQQQAVHHRVADVVEVVPLRSSAYPKQPSLSSESTVVEAPANVSSQRQPSPPRLKQPASVRNARAQSASPVRSARFALGADRLVIRHEPPPRSVSPRKSAMKHSASPSRGASPSDEGSEASGPSRVGSEATALEAPMPRKKSVRVSFDDENTKIVGQSAVNPDFDSPVFPSPQQAKRHWYNHLGRNRKKDTVTLDDDEVMKPRPALPSFGSVREKKPRDSEEERPLVRPLESLSPSGPGTTDFKLDRPVPAGQSVDHNVGMVLSQEQTARNAANISRFREPLPPVVTSLEGSGYYSPSSTSDSDADDEDEIFQDSEVAQELEPTMPPEQFKEEIVATQPELAVDTPIPSTQTVPVLGDGRAQDHREEEVPSISVIQPTPIPKETEGNGSASLSEQGYFDVPGGFPEDESEDNSVRLDAPPEMTVMTKDQPAQATAFRGGVNSSKAGHSLVPVIESESEGESIYSDAYEDLSDIDGDGFMSLDAVIASPIQDKPSHKLYQKSVANTSQQTPEDSLVATSENDVGSSYISSSSQRPADQPEDEWEKAKLFWRGLTSDKRKQLEQEALEEAGAEGDLEEVVQPVKVKRKKSVRKSDPATQQQASANPERVYQIQPGTRAIDEEDEQDSPAALRKTLRVRQGQETGSTNGGLQKTMRGGQAQTSSASGTGMRKTLRSDVSSSHIVQSSQPTANPIGGMKKSMRQNGSSPQAQPRMTRIVNGRPVSLQGPPSGQNAQPKNLPMDNSMSSVELAKAMQATLRRRASDSSESSFRRARPKQDGFGFRKSMRINAETDLSVAGRNSRFSLRSMSPPASPISSPANIGNRTTMRSTLRRDSSDGSTRRMRLPTFGKSSSSKKAVGKTGRSRFGESSDEDNVGQSAFRSRFAESSDEDEVPAPAPVIHNKPRSMGASSSAAAAAMKVPPPHNDEKAEESPDLPDSSDEEAVRPPVQQKPLSPRRASGASGRLVKPQLNGQGLQRSGSGRGALAESTTPAMGTQVMSRPGGHQRRGSFLSVLLRKKESEVGKISRPAASESGARMDTKLERNTSEITALRGATTSPKPQKQTTHDNWPLVETLDDEKRPMTADNNRPVDESRPVFMKRRSTNQVLISGLPDDREGSVQPDGSGKKKKFGTLRRMFKLDD